MGCADRGARQFVLKLFLALLPLITLGLLFVVLDPFRVLYSYADYSHDMHVALNRGHVSVEVFKKNRHRLKYDSFIFGSSRTLAFDTHDWRRFLDPEASAFHFDASAENVYGILTKILFVRSQGSRLRNALIIICPDVTFKSTSPKEGHLFIPHYDLTGQSPILYHAVFFRAFMDPRFLMSFFSYRATGQVRPWMGDYLEARKIVFDPETNDIRLPDLDAEIERTGELFWEKRASAFQDLPALPQPYPPQITSDVESQLRVIADAIANERTDFRLIVSPLLERRALASSDAALLRTIFGDKSVLDFSGANGITADKHNYYEPSHYRPQVGRWILEKAYQGRYTYAFGEHSPDMLSLSMAGDGTRGSPRATDGPAIPRFGENAVVESSDRRHTRPSSRGRTGCP